MAKKNKKNNFSPLSPKRFLAEKASSLPIFKCYITDNWETEGEAHIIIARTRGNGNLCVGNFLVDTWCAGVKDAFGDVNMEPDKLDELLSHTFEMVECDYPTVHNIIYGAVEFAGEAGILPPPQYDTWKGILSEDNDDVPYIDIEFGRNGKYWLVSRPGTREALLAPKLKKTLGDKFQCEIVSNPFEMQDDFEEETYSYKHPEYPSSPEVRNQFIADELLNESNLTSLPEEVIDRILLLDPDEAAKDLGNIVMYEIGRTYKAIDNDEIATEEEVGNSALIHAMILLAEIKSRYGTEPLLEMLRQDEAFLDVQYGDMAFELLPDALAASAKDNLEKLEAFLYEEGLYNQLHVLAAEALALIANDYPDKRSEIIGIFRRLLNSLPERLPDHKGCDAIFAGILMGSLCECRAKELLPEIKAVIDTDEVDTSIAGDFDEMKEHIDDYTTYSRRSLTEKYDLLSDSEQDN